MAQLADELAQRGLRGRGRHDYPIKPLTVSAVADLLASPVYLGIVEWEGVTYPGQHEPLVSSDTFHRVQQLLAARAVRGIRERRHDHELKGMLWCGVCGRRLSLTLAKSRYLYFYCLGQKNQARTGCREAYVPADLLETAVERLYDQVQLPPAWLERLQVALDAEITSRQDRNARERQLLTRRMAKLEGERRKLLDAYYASAIDLAVLRGEQERIGGELRTAEQRLAAVDATLTQWREVLETAMRFAADCGRAYRKASHKTRRLFNAAVFDRIEVRDRKLASITYKAPFDALFGANKFEYDALVAQTLHNANRPLLVEGPTVKRDLSHHPQWRRGCGASPTDPRTAPTAEELIARHRRLPRVNHAGMRHDADEFFSTPVPQSPRARCRSTSVARATGQGSSTPARPTGTLRR